MGHTCPECGKYVPQVRVLTADFKPPVKAADVIGFMLGCGHTTGKKELLEFNDEVKKIREDTQKRVHKIETEAAEKIRGAYENLKARSAAKEETQGAN